MRLSWKCVFVVLLVLESLGEYKGAAGGQDKIDDQIQCSSTKSDRQLTRNYCNKHFNFAFQYPAQWSIYNGFDGNGVSIYPPSIEKGVWRSTISVGGSIGQPSEVDSVHLQTLQEDYESRVRAMRVGPASVRNIKVVSREVTTVESLPAIISTVEFDRGNPNQSWVLKQILIHSRDDRVSYHLSLMCKPKDLPVLTQSFTEVVETFRILGPPA